jgi:hypothetical protein
MVVSIVSISENILKIICAKYVIMSERKDFSIIIGMMGIIIREYGYAQDVIALLNILKRDIIISISNGRRCWMWK